MAKKSEITLHPTGTCFDDALEFIEELVKYNPRHVWDNRRVFLVHGICRFPSGDRYSHAWVEIDGIVFGIYLFKGERVFWQLPRASYYRQFRVVTAKRYTVRDAVHMNRKHGTYGPWETRFLKLCRNHRGGK